jgi:hypothetical protein
LHFSLLPYRKYPKGNRRANRGISLTLFAAGAKIASLLLALKKILKKFEKRY